MKVAVHCLEKGRGRRDALFGTSINLGGEEGKALIWRGWGLNVYTTTIPKKNY